MTFAELQNEAQKIYKRARAEAERVESEKAHIREVYTPKIAAENCADEDRAFLSFVNDCADEFESKVHVCLAKCRESLDKTLLAAPTNEQLNLLHVISMRGESVSENEFARLCSLLATNYQATKALQAIAKKNNARIHLSDKYDFEALTASLEWLESYLSDRVRDLRCFSGHKIGQLGNAFFVEGCRDPNYEERASRFE